MVIGSRILTLLLCFMMCVNIAFAEPATGSSTGMGSSSSSTTDSDKDKDKDKEESEEESISVVKVKDKDGKEVEIEIKDGMTPDGKIWIGAGAKPKAHAQKVQEIKDTKVKGQSVPGLTLVENMRNLIAVMPFRMSNLGLGNSSKLTGCAYAISVACAGTPYGEGWFVNDVLSPNGAMTSTAQLISKAKELDQLILVTDDNMSEVIPTIMPGDICIIGYDDISPGINAYGDPGYRDHHATMASLLPDGTIGTIQNGGTPTTPGNDINNGKYGYTPEEYRDDKWGGGGIKEWPAPPWSYSNQKLGWVIKTSGYAGSMLSFGDAITKLGEAMNLIIEKFCEVAQGAYNRIYPYTFDILACLCMIDLALTIMLAGFEINPNQLFVKVIKYGFIYWVVSMWPTIVDACFKSMVVSANEIAFPTLFEAGSENICQPQLILQKVMYLLKPGFDYFSKFTITQAAVAVVTGSVGLMFLAGILCIITMIIYILFACYVAYVYIYFFVLAALSVCTLPFWGSKFLKFFSEGAVGSVWTAAVKMMTLTFMIGLMGIIFSGSDYAAANEVVKTAGNASSNFSGGASLFDMAKGNYDMFIFFTKQCAMMILFAFLTFRIVNSLSSHLGGRFELNL